MPLVYTWMMVKPAFVFFLLPLASLFFLPIAAPLASASSSRKESAGLWSRLTERWRGDNVDLMLSEFDPSRELKEPPSWIDDEGVQVDEEALYLPKVPPAMSEDYLRVAYGTLARKIVRSGQSNLVKVDEEAWKDWDERFGCEKFRQRHGEWLNESGRWHHSRSFQEPVQAKCGDRTTWLQHVSILVASSPSLPPWLDGLFSCPCSLSCTFSRSPLLASHPHAVLSEPLPHPSQSDEATPGSSSPTAPPPALGDTPTSASHSKQGHKGASGDEASDDVSRRSASGCKYSRTPWQSWWPFSAASRSAGGSPGGNHGGGSAAEAAAAASGGVSRNCGGSGFSLGSGLTDGSGFERGSGRVSGVTSKLPPPALSVCVDLQGDQREGGGGTAEMVCDGADMVVGLLPSSDVQVTYAGNLLHMDRNRRTSATKLKTPPAIHASSRPSPWRQAVLYPFLKVAHSVGDVGNNMAGGEDDVLDRYPECAYAGRHPSTVTLGSREGGRDKVERVEGEREREREREREWDRGSRIAMLRASAMLSNILSNKRTGSATRGNDGSANSSRDVSASSGGEGERRKGVGAREGGGSEFWWDHVQCVASHYLFTLAAENREEAGHASEKAFQALEAGTVPVYFGAPDVREFLPPDSFLDGSKLQREDLRHRMVKAYEDLPSYLSFHAWRRCGVIGNLHRSLRYSLDNLPCRLCEHISHRLRRKEERTRQQ